MAAHRCDRVAGAAYRMGGVLGDYLDSVSEQWLKPAPRSNPALVEMFRDRDRRPLRDLTMFAGEYAGKYLTGAVQVLRLTGDAELRRTTGDVVRALVSCQGEDGYLGPWPSECGLTNRAPNSMLGAPLWTPREGGDTWDAWGHYHLMLGLLLWHEDSGDDAALQAARRMGDLLCRRYLGQVSPRLVDTGWPQVNLAPAHSLALLYRTTGEARYLRLAEQLVAEFGARGDDGAPLAGDYLEGTLAGREFFELASPRWEGLHPIMALAELAAITGSPAYRDAFERIWRSIAAADRRNSGAFGSVEQATGDPYAPGAVETCCTVAWIALSVEMLRLTGDPRVADELELSTLNAVLAYHSVSGRWVTYDTPDDGTRLAAHAINSWQSRPGSPELNCCSVNGARGLGMVSDWALMRDEDGLVLNWYGPSEITAPLHGGVTVTLRQITDYPRGGRVELHVAPTAPAAFCLKLRIPRWSTDTRVTVNGDTVSGGAVLPGSYLPLQREWRDGDTVAIDLDLAVHCWSGHNARAGLTSLYRGPILLGFDGRHNDIEPDELPALDARRLDCRPAPAPGWLPPALLLELTAGDGRRVRLCDFASAGEGGTRYRSWLPVEHVDPTRPQCFAPTPEQRLRAEIGRHAQLYRAFQNADGAARRRPLLVRLCREWPAFVEHCARARARIEADPGGAATRPLAEALARIEADSDLLDPACGERLQQELARSSDDPVCTLSDWRVSSLQPGLADLARAGLLPDSEISQPLQPRGGSAWASVDGVHRGGSGIVYLRVTARMPRTERARLMYGAHGPVKLWVNGREADYRPDSGRAAPGHPATPEEYRTLVHWREGDNTLVFALDARNGATMTGVHVSIPDR